MFFFVKLLNLDILNKTVNMLKMLLSVDTFMIFIQADTFY